MDLGRYLDAEMIPRLTLESVYTDPSHCFRQGGDKARGGCPWHESKSGTSFVVDRKTLQWWCAGCLVGGGPLQYLHRLRGGVGASPRGHDFLDLMRDLAQRAGVPLPERELTEADKEQARRLETRRCVLQSVAALCELALWTQEMGEVGKEAAEAGKAARAYLHARGFTEADLRELRIGLYPQLEYLKREFQRRGHTAEDISESCTLDSKLVGYTTWPWRDDTGALLTLYGKWPDKTPPAGRPKTTALPNPRDGGGKGWLHSKRSPYLLDRALAAGHRDLILVEGPTDAALPQLRGDARVIACVAAQLSGDQVETLRRRGVRSVIIALDPDQAGESGVESCVRQLAGAGIRPYVAPKLPDGLDPDEFILRDGIDGWKKHVAHPAHGYRHLAQALIDGHGVREPGDDLWTYDLIEKAVALAEKQPGEAAADLLLYFWPAVAEATGTTVDVLAARTKSKTAAVPPSENAPSGDAAALSVIDSATFAATEYPLRWILKAVLREGPADDHRRAAEVPENESASRFGHRHRGRPLLPWRLQADRPMRVGFFSGESGPHTIQDTARNVCRALGIELADAGVYWGFTLPQLSRDDHWPGWRRSSERTPLK